MVRATGKLNPPKVAIVLLFSKATTSPLSLRFDSDSESTGSKTLCAELFWLELLLAGLRCSGGSLAGERVEMSGDEALLLPLLGPLSMKMSRSSGETPLSLAEKPLPLKVEKSVMMNDQASCDTYGLT